MRLSTPSPSKQRVIVTLWRKLADQILHIWVSSRVVAQLDKTALLAKFEDGYSSGQNGPKHQPSGLGNTVETPVVDNSNLRSATGQAPL